MTDQISQLLTAPPVSADLDGLPSGIRPVKYRYCLADIRTGQLIAMLPMTGVQYAIGIYSGTEMSGSVYLPDMRLDEMATPPGFEYARWRHPDQGLPLASLFEVGNRAIYVMRNEKVVWGGILWGRSYSSSGRALQINALSWDGYIYYRALRRSVIFLANTPKYTIWRGLLSQVLHDFNWAGDNGRGQNAGWTNDATVTTWTGKTVTKANGQTVGNQPLEPQVEYWPYNSAPILLPPAELKFKNDNLNQVNYGGDGDHDFWATENRWRGYDMQMVGDQLQTWADQNTLTTGGGFEYRVLCWYDYGDGTVANPPRFKQRYTFGEMEYDSGTGDISGTPTSILSPLLGRPREKALDTIFDFPGHIRDWSLTEGMEEVATRVIVTGDTGADGASKIAAYAAQRDMMQPGYIGNGSNGWLLYDKVFGYSSADPKDIAGRAGVLRDNMRPSIAAQVNDIANVNTTQQRTSKKATDLSITLYQDPTTIFPTWAIGDWVTFAITDPFYGGTMYLQRRIIGYTVTVVGDHESDYSHEQIALDLTDQTKVSDTEPAQDTDEV